MRRGIPMLSYLAEYFVMISDLLGPSLEDLQCGIQRLHSTERLRQEREFEEQVAALSML